VEALALWWIGAGAGDGQLLEPVCRQVGEAFGRAVQRIDDPRRPTDTLDGRRGQHSSGAILRWVAALRPAQRLVAVTDVDLFVPVLTFVFGEAQLGGHAALVSTARLVPDDGSAMLRARLAKEVVHELGHTFGLTHCPDHGCAMARSATLYDVDRKRAWLCPDCHSLLQDRERGGTP
jgi:archaemetzincin